MKRLLSTKKLTSPQRDILLKSELNFVEYDAIKIKCFDFEAPKKIKNAIFSSQNAVESFFSSHNSTKSLIENVFCVGEKTKALLLKNEQKVVKMANNAIELANFIVKNYKKGSFTFFCGNDRRDEIPSLLKIAEIELFEVKTYKTELNSIKFDDYYDGILFFSPSGIESFTSLNKMNESIAFCIGATTANEAKKHFDKIVIAETAVVEDVIDAALNYLINEA